MNGCFYPVSGFSRHFGSHRIACLPASTSGLSEVLGGLLGVKAECVFILHASFAAPPGFILDSLPNDSRTVDGLVMTRIMDETASLVVFLVRMVFSLFHIMDVTALDG